MVWDILIAGHGLTVKLILTKKKCFKTKTLRSHSISLFYSYCVSLFIYFRRIDKKRRHLKVMYLMRRQMEPKEVITITRDHIDLHSGFQVANGWLGNCRKVFGYEACLNFKCAFPLRLFTRVLTCVRVCVARVSQPLVWVEYTNAVCICM